jgi:uncharacterized protein (DUF433 family)
MMLKFILILGRFAKAKLLRMSYTERNSIIKFANLFRFGIIEYYRTFALMINWKEHIISDPEILAGKPVIKGTRISVELILEKLSEEETVDQILIAYPHINKENILACLAFAKDSLNNEVTYQLVS